MTVESSLHVIDARDLYLKWNRQKLESLVDSLSDDALSIINLIPLLLHVNSRFLPGYIGLDVPSGIFTYLPDQATLKLATLINKKFRYQDEGRIKNSAIDAVYFQKKILDGSMKCWVFKDSNLTKDQSDKLREKLDKIVSWVTSQGLSLGFEFLSGHDFRESTKYTENENRSIFLDYFYSEATLLAGKYPVWWLVPPNKNDEYSAFVEHIKQARFVDSAEYIDLGSTNDFHKSDILRYSVEQIKTVKKSAETCLVKLIIASRRCSAWPKIDGMSIRLKDNLYHSKDNVGSIYIVSDMMKEAFVHDLSTKQKYNPNKIVSGLKRVSRTLNQDVLDAFLGDDYYREGFVSEIDNVVSYLNLFKSIATVIKEKFSEIVDACALNSSDAEYNSALDVTVKNMLFFLSDNPDRVPIYNNKDSNDIVLNRIQLKHEVGIETDKWSLVLLESEGNEKTIEGFNNLLALLAWCWLNRLVNRLTQVSVNCPLQQVRQTEARYMLDVLMQGVNPQLISDIPAEAFDHPIRPLQSLLFLNFMDDKVVKTSPLLIRNKSQDDNAMSLDSRLYCEQLAVNSWGDAYTKQYIGDMGVLKCLCDWTHYSPLDSMSLPQNLEAFGHGTGDSTHIAQRVNQIYAEMVSFFYQARSMEGRFFLRLGSSFYVVRVEDGLLMPDKIGNKRDLIESLEEPLSCFSHGMLESKAVVDEPLKEIYQLNKENVLQVFFKVSNRRAYCWVLDERGALWRDVIDDFDRDSFVTHWLYLFKNIRNRLKKTSHENKELPGLEIKQISTNQLGGLEFYLVGSDSLTGGKNFIDVQVTIEHHDERDQLSLTCDGRNFSYEDFKRNALIECVHYISSKILIAGLMPIYVTDINVPLRLFNINQRDELQSNHILKFKRSFENRIYKLLETN
jgi:adenylate cyclase, class 1